MAVNEYMQPVRDTFQQDYVSQHIPLPFAQMQKAVDVKQKQYDDTTGTIDDINASIAKIDTIPGAEGQIGADEAYKNERLADYNNRISEISESVGGDYGKAQNEIRGLANKLKKELSTGPLGEMHKRGEQFKRDMELQDKIIAKGGRGAETARDIKANYLRKYNEAGGKLGDAEYNLYNLAPTPDVQAKMAKFAGQMKPQINTYLGLLKEESQLAIDGYDTRSTTKKKELAKEVITKALDQMALSDKDVRNFKDIMNDASYDSDEMIQNLITATGMQFEVDQTDKDLKDLRKPTQAEKNARTKAKIYNDALSTASITIANQNTDKINQQDQVEIINQSKKDIVRALDVKEITNNPNLIFNDDGSVDSDHVSTKIMEKYKKGEFTAEERDQHMNTLRTLEQSRSQQKYEIDTFYNDPTQQGELEKHKNYLSEEGLSDKTINKLLYDSNSLSWLESALATDFEKDVFKSWKKTNMQNMTPQEQQEIETMLRKSPEDNKFIQERITQHRDAIDSYAKTKKLRTTGRQLSIWGNPTARKDLQSAADEGILYNGEFMKNNVNALTFTNEKGITQQAVDFQNKASTELKKLGGVNSKSEVIFLPTSATGSEYIYKMIVKNSNTTETREQYVKANNAELGQSMYRKYKGDLEKQRYDSDGKIIPGIDKLIMGLEAGNRFKQIDKVAINNILRGNEETSGWGYTDPATNETYNFTFKKIKNKSGKPTGVEILRKDGSSISSGDTIDDALVKLHGRLIGRE